MTTARNVPEWVWLDGEWCGRKHATLPITALIDTARCLRQRIPFFFHPEGARIFRLAEALADLLRAGRLLGVRASPVAAALLPQAAIEAAALHGGSSGWLEILLLALPGLEGEELPQLVVFAHSALPGNAPGGRGEPLDLVVEPLPGRSFPTQPGAEAASPRRRPLGPVERWENDEVSFWLEGDRLCTGAVTVPFRARVLRQTLLELAAEAGLGVVEAPPERHRLLLADEIFVAGGAAELRPVARVDGLPLSGPFPGPWTERLGRALERSLLEPGTHRAEWWTPIPQCEGVWV